MDITCTLSNNRALVGLSGRMDAVTAPAFEQHCESLITQGTTAVIADMSGRSGFTSLDQSAAKLRWTVSLAMPPFWGKPEGVPPLA